MNRRAYKGLSTTAGAAWAAVVTLCACGEGAAPAPTEPAATTNEALNTVIACQQQEDACAADAGNVGGLVACEHQLRQCLANLFLEAGVPQIPGDAGWKPTPPPQFDGGVPIPDGGVPSDPACLASLHLCLDSNTSPSTCASDAKTCFANAANARCDAQESECLAAGVPVAACQAARQACH
jgi:hypothetical protein